MFHPPPPPHLLEPPPSLFVRLFGTKDRQGINKSIQEENKLQRLVAEVYGCVVQFRQFRSNQGAKKGEKVTSST